MQRTVLWTLTEMMMEMVPTMVPMTTVMMCDLVKTGLVLKGFLNAKG